MPIFYFDDTIENLSSKKFKNSVVVLQINKLIISLGLNNIKLLQNYEAFCRYDFIRYYSSRVGGYF